MNIYQLMSLQVVSEYSEDMRFMPWENPPSNTKYVVWDESGLVEGFAESVEQVEEIVKRMHARLGG